MRITVICSDVSQNVLTRARLLATILSRDFDVDLIGMDFGTGVWGPAAGQAFHRIVPGSRWPLFHRSVAALGRAIRGDIVYAVKPLASSYGVALRHRARTGRPVILDADDEELAFRSPGSWRHPLRALSALSHPLGHRSTRRIMARASEADAVTVATTGLQGRFGGVIIPQAQDTDAVRPGLSNREVTRRALGVHGQRVVVFMGTPRPFKGIEDAAAAVRLMRNPARFLLVGADAASPYVQTIARAFPEITILPPYRMADLPRLLDVADAVVAPSRLGPETVHQQPGKLLDAMAMSKPIVATNVSDIPAMLGDGRGLLVPPSDPRAIAVALDRIFDDPGAAALMGSRAREWCVANASYNAMQPVLRGLIHEVARRTLPRGPRRV